MYNICNMYNPKITVKHVYVIDVNNKVLYLARLLGRYVHPNYNGVSNIIVDKIYKYITDYVSYWCYNASPSRNYFSYNPLLEKLYGVPGECYLPYNVEFENYFDISLQDIDMDRFDSIIEEIKKPISVILNKYTNTLFTIKRNNEYCVIELIDNIYKIRYKELEEYIKEQDYIYGNHDLKEELGYDLQDNYGI